MKIKVGVIFGGSSVEHEISVISALQAIDNINRDNYDIIPIYISKNKEWYTGADLLNIENYRDLDELLKHVKRVNLQKIDNEYYLVHSSKLFSKIISSVDIILPIVHGQNVEDGSLSGYLETIGIPYAGSNVLASALGQDKVIMKQVFSSCGIPTVSYTWFYDYEYEKDKDKYLKEIAHLGYPVVVKPASLGSSVGINFVKSEKEIEDAIKEAISYDRKIVVEKGVQNLIEVNCSILGNYEHQEVSVLEEVLSSNNILTFDDKYIGDGKKKGAAKGMVNTSRIIPANIDKDLTKKIEDISVKVFKALNLSGVCRIDYLIDSKAKEVYVNEPNTIPGSLAFYLWEAKGKKYSELLDDIIKLGVKEYKNKQSKTTCFDTNVLKDFKKGGIKK